jgi:hypothetical protein
MKGVQTEPVNIGWGTSSVTGSAAPDVALFTPATETRAAGTSTGTQVAATTLADIYQLTGTLTCLVGSKTITEVGMYDTTTLSGTTTLATTLSSAATTSLTVGAAIGPTTLNFYIQVEHEVMLVTGGQNTPTMTVTRGSLGTTSATHAVGVSVTVGGDGGARANFTLGGQTATVGNAQGGNMFCHADFTGIALSVNDSILFTFQDTLT